MKIKHWQGYGSVNVKKLAEYDTNRFTGEKKIIIEVTGMHECGLSRKDPYDIYNCCSNVENVLLRIAKTVATSQKSKYLKVFRKTKPTNQFMKSHTERTDKNGVKNRISYDVKQSDY